MPTIKNTFFEHLNASKNDHSRYGCQRNIFSRKYTRNEIRVFEAQLKRLMLSIKKIVTILSLSDLHFDSV